MKINMMKAAAVAVLILTGTAASAQTWTEWRDLQVNITRHLKQPQRACWNSVVTRQLEV